MRCTCSKGAALPLALRSLGKWVGKMRRMSNHFRAGVETMIREAELAEIEKEWRERNARIMAEHPDAEALDTTTPAPYAPPFTEPIDRAADPDAAAEAAIGRAKPRTGDDAIQADSAVEQGEPEPPPAPPAGTP